MEYTGVTEFRSVTSYRFTIPSTMFDPAYHNNREFCNKDTPQFFNSTVQIRRFSIRKRHILVFSHLPPERIPRCWPYPARLAPGLPLPGPLPRCPEGSCRRDYRNEAGQLEERHDICGYRAEYRCADPRPPGHADQHRDAQGQPRVSSPPFDPAILPSSMLSRMSNMILPVLWMNETITFDEGTRKQLAGLNMAK